MQVKITISKTLDIKREEKWEADRTAYQGAFAETYENLTNIFGEPNENGKRDKTKAQWNIKTPDGIATIYDYKSDKEPEDNTDWHVGGRKPEVYHWIILAIKKAYEK